jgi:hypothetical protein
LAPRRWKSSTGWTTRPGAFPSYRWKRPWSMTTGRPPRRPSRSRPTWPGAVAAGPAGQVGERDRHRILEVIGKAAKTRTQDDPDLGHEIRPGADRGLERVEARGWSIGRDGRCWIHGHRLAARAGRQCFVQGSTAGGPRDFCGPDGSTDTGMPVTSRQAVPGTAQERRRDRVQKRPKRPALAGGPLM